MKKKRLLNSLISVGTYTEFLDALVHLATDKSSSYICISNVHMLIEAYKDPSFNAILNNADIATPDGMPLAKCLSLFYKQRQDRIAGMDLFPSLLKKAQEEKLTVFLYGSTEEVLLAIKDKAVKEFPGLRISGSISPPFRPLNEIEKQEIIHKINSSHPDFLFVSLGCPKQEKWMAEHKDKIKSCMIGIGGAFPVYAGLQNRAPRWMQRFSLEWLYRLGQEPKRLWKRYFYTNSLFVILITSFYFKNIFLNKQQ
jgi:N-acetylglucosaminyldiphosphoundecaprenol N-acetyl-beta-D-mannosaminyltransferase